ncbi:tetratricopeptide repeat protein, partial [Saccharopolyspora sp. K220]|uniref:tetratricopeptide repeat protein n=1 Tax=Saccharopolyspora soli TaxID=2926618 RepID=UPI001F5A07CD
EAVAIRRELAAVERVRYAPDLAASLNSLGSSLSDLGRFGEALEATEEAVAIRRELAAASPDAFEERLMDSLNALVVRLSDLGRPSEALSVAQEVVDYYKSQSERDKFFERDFATSLTSQAALTAQLGLMDEAYYAYRTALKVQSRVLGNDHPDTLATRHNLAGVLQGRGELAEAEAEYRAVLRAQQRILGDDHPDTLA